MNIIYIHGLDSGANSTKGLLLERYCQQYHPDITVWRLDLNQSPAQVLSRLIDVVATLRQSSKTVLLGSSLGGYFSTLVSNRTGCPVLLLNPSTQPHITLQRFSNSHTLLDDIAKDRTLSNQVIHTTSGGWAITGADLQWFAKHQLQTIAYPKEVAVWIKAGDELLNPHLSAKFYQQQGATVTLQAGGNHRFSDFAEQLPRVIEILQQLG